MTKESEEYVHMFNVDSQGTIKLKEQTTIYQHGLICFWQTGSAIKMPSVLVKQLLTD